MEIKRKQIQRLAAVTVFLILVFMMAALVQFRKEEDMSLLPDQFEVYYNENWTMISLDGSKASKVPFTDHDSIQEMVQRELAEGGGQKVDLPYTGNSSADDIVVFQNILPEQYAGLTLYFNTDAMVRVVFDGEVIYEYGLEEQGTLGKTFKNDENLVCLPNVFQAGEIWIELSSPYADTAASLSAVKIETRDMVVIGVVGNSIADIGCCLLIVFMAIIMFVLVLIRLYTHQPSRGELFLGLAGLSAGVYCFIGTNTLSIFYDIQEAYVMQEYFVLLIPVFLALYFERNLYTIYPRRFLAISVFVCINGAVQLLLHTLGVCRLENMITVSAVVVGIVCVTAVVSLIQRDYGKKQYRTFTSLLALLVLLSGGIVNIVMNIIYNDTRGNPIGQYSMTVFAIMIAVVHILQLSKEYRANAEENARLLEEKIKVTNQQNVQLSQARKEAELARQEALDANEAKGKFLAHMSHEIRTPINAVLGMDEMILRESEEQNIREYAMDIYTAGQTLLSLINDILDFSKIDSGKMEIVPIEYDVSSMIHDMAQMALGRAKDKNIRLEVEVEHEIPSRLYGDDVRIRQVLTNILTNAIKYTHKGTVWLRVQSHRTEDKEGAILHFEVEDTGIGIKEEDLPRLFAEFERIEEERNRNIEGSGLGMNITIQLLELMGSRLRVNSVYGKGSKFYFDLEQKVIDQTPIGDFEARVSQIAGNYSYNVRFIAPEAKILVVDDNAVNRKVFRNLLKETCIQVEEAEKGMECLELVQKNHYNLIFLDHMMPEMDGIETLHRIKALEDSPCRHTPIVVLTANAVSGAKEKYLSVGFDDFLSKPIVPEKLETMIQKMLPEELLQEFPASEKKATQGDIASKGETWVAQNVAVGKEEAETAQNVAVGKGKIKAALQINAGLDALEALPQVDGLDWQYAWMHLPDMELLEYTVKEFYAQIDSAAEHLEQAYQQITQPQQLEEYRIQVHAMKSLAATVGIMPLAGIAKVLEYAARDGKIDVITSMTAIFLEEWRSYRKKLQGVFGIKDLEKKEMTDYSVVQALVEMVRLGMQEMDIDQADQSIGQLQAYHYPGETDENIRKLGEAVTNLDVEEVCRLADLIIGQISG